MIWHLIGCLWQQPSFKCGMLLIESESKPQRHETLQSVFFCQVLGQGCCRRWWNYLRNCLTVLPRWPLPHWFVWLCSELLLWEYCHKGHLYWYESMVNYFHARFFNALKVTDGWVRHWVQPRICLHWVLTTEHEYFLLSINRRQTGMLLSTDYWAPSTFYWVLIIENWELFFYGVLGTERWVLSTSHTQATCAEEVDPFWVDPICLAIHLNTESSKWQTYHALISN